MAMNNIDNVKAFLPLEYFKEISKIPRGSGNETEIANYLCDFAKKNGLWYSKDENNNVFIKKNATQGRPYREKKGTVRFASVPTKL